VKYLPLLWSGLWRKPIRTVLTILSIAVAFLLFGVLQGVITGFDGARSKLSDTRLRVTNRANIIEGIPIAYKSQIARIPGVHAISHFVIFIGYYQDRKNGFSIAAVDVDSWLDAIPNFHVPTDQQEAMHTTRTGALVGSELMKRFDWHIGDRISLSSMMWANKDGTSEWPLDIVGVVNAGPDDDQIALQHTVHDRASRAHGRRVAVIPPHRIGRGRDTHQLRDRRRNEQRGRVQREQPLTAIERLDSNAPRRMAHARHACGCVKVRLEACYGVSGKGSGRYGWRALRATQ